MNIYKEGSNPQTVVLDYFKERNHEDFSTWVNDKFGDLAFTGSDYSSRILNHWLKEKLIPLKGEHEKHAKWQFNLIELVWLMTVGTFRNFGLPIPLIAEIKSSILDNSSLENAMNKLTPKVKGYVNKRFWSSTHPYLEYALYSGLILNNRTYLVSDSNGAAAIMTQAQFSYETTIKGVTSSIFINILDIIQDIFPERNLKPMIDTKPPKFYHDMARITPALYEAMKDSTTTRIELHLNNGTMETLTITSREDIESTLSQLVNRDDYQELTVKTEKKKIQIIDRTKKIKLKS